jgi:hypothetical protein
MSFPLKSQLFNLDLFNPNVAVFPEQVFKEKFDNYLFMNLEDWFKDEALTNASVSSSRSAEASGRNRVDRHLLKLRPLTVP